ncbi:hypothetical protein D3C78_1785260 [compost metagenome]
MAFFGLATTSAVTVSSLTAGADVLALDFAATGALSTLFFALAATTAGLLVAVAAFTSAAGGSIPLSLTPRAAGSAANALYFSTRF